MTPSATELPTSLEQIRKAHDGILRPVDVVEAASDENHPLHGSFEWNDTRAAAQYRLWQARELIQVAVTVLEGDPKRESIRAYVSLGSDRENPGGGYRFIGSVLRNSKQRRELFEQALAELRAFEAKYRQLRRLRPIFTALRKITA